MCTDLIIPGNKYCTCYRCRHTAFNLHVLARLSTLKKILNYYNMPLVSIRQYQNKFTLIYALLHPYMLSHISPGSLTSCPLCIVSLILLGQYHGFWSMLLRSQQVLYMHCNTVLKVTPAAQSLLYAPPGFPK